MRHISPLVTAICTRRPWRPLATSVLGLALVTGLPATVSAETDANPTAQAQVARGDWTSAEQTIAQGLAAHPKDVRLRLLQGMVWAHQGKLAQAQTAFEAMIADHPELSEPYNNLGIVLAQQGDNLGAKQQFEKALLADPQNQQAQANLARVSAP